MQYTGTPAQQSGPPNNANQAREGAQQEKVHTDKPQHNEPITSEYLRGSIPQDIFSFQC